MYTQDQFLEDVKKEADAIKKNATNQEIAMLDIEELNHRNSYSCIYGQMTGFCYSERAANLIKQCTPRYFTQGAIAGMDEYTAKGIEEIINAANGNDIEYFVVSRIEGYSIFTHFSAIEAYIGWGLANNAGLIDYIQGKTDTLTL